MQLGFESNAGNGELLLYRHIQSDLRTFAGVRYDLNVSFDGEGALLHSAETERQRGSHTIKQLIRFETDSVVGNS